MNNEIKNNLNIYLSNNAVMYIKLHNLHWNVVGLNFKSVHEYLETLYDGFSDSIDEIAEMIKIEGDYPLAKLSDYLKNASIEELDSKNYKIDEVLNILKDDFILLKKQAESIRDLANTQDNYMVTGMLEGHLTNFNKTLWFIDSMTK